MLVTALSPVIGYQNAAHIAEVTTLKQAALRSGRVGEVRFDNTIMPLSMDDEGLGGASGRARRSSERDNGRQGGGPR